MNKNPIIEIIKIISIPIIPFIMLWIKLYSIIAYTITGIAHILTFGKFPVTRNPLLVFISIPLIQIILLPSLLLILIKGGTTTQPIENQFEKTFNKYEEKEKTKLYQNSIILK